MNYDFLIIFLIREGDDYKTDCFLTNESTSEVLKGAYHLMNKRDIEIIKINTISLENLIEEYEDDTVFNKYVNKYGEAQKEKDKEDYQLYLKLKERFIDRQL